MSVNLFGSHRGSNDSPLEKNDRRTGLRLRCFSRRPSTSSKISRAICAAMLLGYMGDADAIGDGTPKAGQIRDDGVKSHRTIMLAKRRHNTKRLQNEWRRQRLSCANTSKQ